MKNRKKALFIGILAVFILCAITYLIASQADLFEKCIPFLESLDQYEIDELIFVGPVFTLGLIILIFFLIHENSVLKYQSEVNKLKNLLPICANCKKVRDSEGYWHQVEEYISKHTDTKFSHGICQECREILYPELTNNQEQHNNLSIL